MTRNTRAALVATAVVSTLAIGATALQAARGGRHAMRMQEMGYDGTALYALNVRDLDKALAWQATNFGFEVVYRNDEMSWAEVATSVPGLSIGLHAAPDHQPVAEPMFSLGVKDIAKTRSQLESRGVVFDGETMDMGVVKLAILNDQDGNKIMLAETVVAEGGDAH